MKNYLLFIIGFSAMPFLVDAQLYQDAKQQVQSFLKADNRMNNSAQNLQFKIVCETFDEVAQLGKIHAIQKIKGISINDAIVTLEYNESGKILGTNSFTDLKVNVTIPKVAKRKAMKLAAKYHNIVDIQPATIKN
tara:strand:- start:97 stop:501 length:405 start_codon:yes stop_codon:yes gene_type:complete